MQWMIGNEKKDEHKVLWMSECGEHKVLWMNECGEWM